MKIEIEIPEDDLQDVLKRTVLNAINLLVDQRIVEMFIQKQLDTFWQDTLNKQISDELNSSHGIISEVVRKKVTEAIERQIVKQVKEAMKNPL